MYNTVSLSPFFESVFTSLIVQLQFSLQVLNTCQFENVLHSFSGEVYTWGDNDEGQLGDGTTNAIQRPRLVTALQGKIFFFFSIETSNI